MKTMYLPRISISLFFLMLACLGQQAMASVHTWKGPTSPSTDTKWSTASNWVGGRPFDDESGGTIVQFNSAVSGTNFTSVCDIKIKVDYLNFKNGGFIILGDNNSTHELAVASDLPQLDSQGKPQSLRVEGGGVVTIGSVTASQSLLFKLKGSGTETWNILSGSALNVVADMSGATDLDVNATGATVTLSGDNVLFSATFNLVSGTLQLDSPAGKTSIVKSVLIGTNVLAPFVPAVVLLKRNDVLGDDAEVDVNATGTLQVGGVTDTMGALTINTGGKMTLGNGNFTTRDNLVVDGGSLELGGGTLTCANFLQLLNNATLTLGTDMLTGVLNVNDGLAMAGGTIKGTASGKANPDVVNLNSDVTATSFGASSSRIECKVTLNNATRSFSVASGSTQPEFIITGVIAEGSVAGSGIIKRDFGTMRMESATSNTFTGVTTVDRGTLELNTATGLAIPGALVVGNAADPVNTAVLRYLADTQILNDVNKLPSILKSGQLDLNNHVETFTTITGTGNINLGDGSSGSSTFGGITTPGGSFTFGSDNLDNTWGGVLTGMGSFNKVGTGAFTFTGSSTSAGVMNVISGKILLNTVTTSRGASAKLVIGAGTGAANTVSAELVRSNQLPDTGVVVVNSDGLLNLVSSAVTPGASSSDVAGSVTVNGGTVNIGSGQFEITGGLNMTAGKVTATNAGNLVTFSTVTANASATTNAAIEAPVALKSTTIFAVGGGSVQPALKITGIISNGMSGSAGLTKTGAGTLALEGTNANTYTGVTTVDRGLMTVRHTTGFSIVGPVVIGNDVDAPDSAVLRADDIGDQFSPDSLFTIKASGTFDLGTHDETIGSLASTGTTGGKVALGSHNLTLGNAGDSSFGGVIFGTGGVNKVGMGALVLAGQNVYSGPTLVSAGTLIVNGSILNSAVTVGSGALLGGTGAVASAAATTVNASVRPGSLAGGSLHAGNMNVSGGRLAISIDDSTAQKSSRLAVSGNLNVTGAALNFAVSGTAGQAVYELASYDTLTGLFASPSLPSGYTLTYTFDNHVSAKNIAIFVPVLTSPATGVSGGAATLNGAATLTGKAAMAYFQYGKDTTYGMTTPVHNLPAGTQSFPISDELTGLITDSTYHFRLVVVTEDGTVNGADYSFSTPDTPVVVTNAATGVTTSAAKLNGTIDTGGRSGGYYFEYGDTSLTTGFPNRTAVVSKATAAPTPVSVSLANLFGGRTFRFRLVGTFESTAPATNAYYGQTMTFTTLGPVVTTEDPTAVSALSAMAHGTVNTHNKATTVYFEYGLTTTATYNLRTASTVLPIGSGNTVLNVAAVMKPLTFNKAYRYRIVATSAEGVARGETKVFSTISVLPPNIVTQPTPKLAALGQPVSFSVVVNEAVATDSVPTYQWRKNGIAVAGATSATYSISAVTLAQAGNYDCVVKNAAGSSTTSPAVPLAVVDVASKSLKLKLDSTAIMTVNNMGSGLSFAWKKNGASLTSVVPDGDRITVLTKTLTIKHLKDGDAPAGDSDVYTCQITGAAYPSQMLSAVFTLKVFSGKPVITPNPLTMPDALVSAIYQPAVAPAVSGYQIPVDPSSKLVPTSYALVGVLPKGLVLNTTTGVISGRPTVASLPGATPGTYKPYTFSVKAINGIGYDLAPVSLTVKPLPAASIGTFNGLVDRDSDTAPTLTKGYGGKITVTVAPAGTFSGSLGMGALTHPFTGVLESVVGSTTSTSIVTVKRTAPLVALTMNFSFNGDTGKLEGTVTDGVVPPLPLNAWVNPYNATTNKVPAIVATKYTAALEIANAAFVGTDPATNPPGDPANAKYPQGNGYTTVTVAAAGTVTWVGKMADGIIPATYSTTIAADGSIPVQLMLYANTGSAHGWVTAKADAVVQTNGGLSLLDGTIDWNKTAQPPTSKDLVYKNGIPKHDLTVIGGAYVPPPASTPVLGLTDTGVANSTNARIVFSEGGIKDIAASGDLPFVKGSAMAASLDLQVRVTKANVGAFPAGSNPAAVTLSIAPTTGLILGGFALKDNDPTDTTPPTAVLSRPGTYNGLIINRVGVKKGIGFFLLQELPVLGPPKTTLAVMPKLSGQMILEPLPTGP